MIPRPRDVPRPLPRPRRRFRLDRAVLVVMGLYLLGFMVYGELQVQRVRHMEIRLERRLAAVQAANRSLAARIRFLRTPQGQALARQEVLRGTGGEIPVLTLPRR